MCVVSLTISLLIEKVTSFTLGCRKNPPGWTCMHNRANKFKISFRPSSESWFSDFGPFFYFHIIGKISHCHLLSTKAFSLYEVFCMISLLQVLPAVLNVMKEEATLVTLIKPQFEAHRSQVCNLISALFWVCPWFLYDDYLGGFHRTKMTWTHRCILFFAGWTWWDCERSLCS